MRDTLEPLGRTIVEVRDSWDARGGMVGSAAAIVTADGVAWADYRGMANAERRRPVGAETLWDWGSITKLVCGIAVLQLRDRGALRLDDSLLDHLPELAGLRYPRGRTRDITLEHLLTHTAGLPNTWRPEPGGHDRPDWDQIASAASRIEVDSPPGATYRYSNLGFTFLGHTGAAVGFRAGLSLDRDRGVGLLAVANADHTMPWIAETRAAFAAGLDG